MFLAGKGDGNIKYLEMVEADPYAHHINDFRSSVSARGCTMLPKRVVDVAGCEIDRILKLSSTAVEVRKATCFRHEWLSKSPRH